MKAAPEPSHFGPYHRGSILDVIARIKHLAEGDGEDLDPYVHNDLQRFYEEYERVAELADRYEGLRD